MEPPIEEWAAAWAGLDGCEASPAESAPANGVRLQSWSGCWANAEVILYTLSDHGHSWPGSPVMPAAITSQAVNATDLIWEFFKAHPMP
jgi:polyhydroxybutyrate depolymerase